MRRGWIVFALVLCACGSSPAPASEPATAASSEPEGAPRAAANPDDPLACGRDDDCVASTFACCECPLCPSRAVARNAAIDRQLTEDCRTLDCVTPEADECPPCPPDEARLAVCRAGRCVLAE